MSRFFVMSLDHVMDFFISPTGGGGGIVGGGYAGEGDKRATVFCGSRVCRVCRVCRVIIGGPCGPL
jgi:hypothetical protein